MSDTQYQVIMEDYEDERYCLPRDKKLIIVFEINAEGHRSVHNLILANDEKSVKSLFRRMYRGNPDMKRIKIEYRPREILD